jgi:hypothetical protein
MNNPGQEKDEGRGIRDQKNQGILEMSRGLAAAGTAAREFPRKRSRRAGGCQTENDISAIHPQSNHP